MSFRSGRPGTSRTREVGHVGKKPAKKTDKVTKKGRRENDPRRTAALEAARKQQAAIDAACVAEPVAAGRPQAQWVKTDPPEPVVVQRAVVLTWSISDVYSLLRQGYSWRRVSERTGYEIEVVVEIGIDLGLDEW